MIFLLLQDLRFGAW